MLLLLLGIGGGIYYSATGKHTVESTAARTAAPAAVNGLSGSEKMPFLQDPRVLSVLEKNGLHLNARKAGSREMAFNPELKTQDFAFPAGAPGAGKVKEAIKARQEFTPFYTVMTIASWRPIAELLEKHGVVSKRNDTWYVVDMPKLMQWMAQGKRWRDIPGNTAYPVNKSILVSTTDVRKSNSAAMFLALASYLTNGNEVVSDEEAVRKVMPSLLPLFLKQGYQEASSAGPFEDYVTMGMGKAPLVMIYEAQFIEYLATTPKEARNPDMVLLYPSPTVFTKHVLVPLTDKGARLGQVLTEDPGLQKIAAEYGLRVNNQAVFTQVQHSRGILAPETLLDVIDPPSYEWLERMIQEIEQKMR